MTTRSASLLLLPAACGGGGGTPPPAPPAAPVPTTTTAPNGTRLSDRAALYPRAIRLAHNGDANGRLLLVGQLVFTAAGTQDASAGRLLMTNANGGEGAWDAAPAPFAVPNVYDNYCPNYSSSPLASADGARVLLVATAYDGPTCTAYFGTGALAP